MCESCDLRSHTHTHTHISPSSPSSHYTSLCLQRNLLFLANGSPFPSLILHETVVRLLLLQVVVAAAAGAVIAVIASLLPLLLHQSRHTERIFASDTASRNFR